jgi:hypothetical protein
MRYLWLVGVWLAAWFDSVTSHLGEGVFLKLVLFACTVGFLEAYRGSIVRDVKSALRSRVPDADP